MGISSLWVPCVGDLIPAFILAEGPTAESQSQTRPQETPGFIELVKLNVPPHTQKLEIHGVLTQNPCFPTCSGRIGTGSRFLGPETPQMDLLVLNLPN